MRRLIRFPKRLMHMFPELTSGGSEADQLLSSCERSAIHLEMRDGYSRTDPMFTAWAAR